MMYKTTLPVIALLGATAVLGWVLYEVGSRFLPGLSVRQATVPSTVTPAARPSASEYQLGQLVSAHLFGVAARPKPVVQQAPETRLRLTLLGVIASTDDKHSRAVIASDQAPDRSYAIGQLIEGTDAKIHSVEESKVILDRQGRFESLVMAKIDVASAGAPQAGRRVAPANARRRQAPPRRNARARRPPSAPRKAPAPNAGSRGREPAQSARPSPPAREGEVVRFPF